MELSFNNYITVESLIFKMAANMAAMIHSDIPKHYCHYKISNPSSWKY